MIDSFQFLVIEDNLGDFFLVNDCLIENFKGSSVINAITYETAKTYLSDSLSSYNIIFLDLRLPDKQGEDLIVNVLNLAKDIPVIILTGYNDIQFSIKALHLGVADYLNKDEINATLIHKSVLYNIERKKKRVELEESKKRYRDLFHLSPIPMWVFDIETLYFLDINQAAIDNYGYSFEEFLSMTIKDIRPETELTKLYTSLNKWYGKGGRIFSGKFKHIKKDGTQIIVEIQGSRIEFDGRKAKLILSNDITDKNNYLEAIKKQNEKLKEIAWIQSHVVRAPVARILSIVNYIKEHALDAEENIFFLESLKLCTLELDEIIRDISDKTNSTNI